MNRPLLSAEPKSTERRPCGFLASGAWSAAAFLDLLPEFDHLEFREPAFHESSIR